MNSNTILELLAEELIPASQGERDRVKDLDFLVSRKNTFDHFGLGGEKTKEKEKQRLGALARSGLLGLIVDYAAQQLNLRGVNSTSGDVDMSRQWRPWEVNGMPSAQVGLYRAAMMYGAAYTMVLPGQTSTRRGPKEAAYIRCFNPDTLFTVYGDLIDDEFPLYALRTISQPHGPVYRLVDEDMVHFVGTERGRLVYIEGRIHGMGVCPVMRFGVNVDLNGGVWAEPEKFKVDARRYEKTTEDRLLAQHYNSWKVRTVTGLAEVADPQERERIMMKLAQDDILTGEGETKFGTLDETNLAPLIQAEEYDRDILAAVSQTPVWAFNGGQLVNLSADALLEAKSGNRQKLTAIQRGFGRAACSTLRLAAVAEGRTEDAWDFSLRADWADLDEVSLSQAFDAWGKGVTQMRIPLEDAWAELPGVGPQKAKIWARHFAENPTGVEALVDAVNRQVKASGENL